MYERDRKNEQEVTGRQDKMIGKKKKIGNKLLKELYFYKAFIVNIAQSKKRIK